MRRLSSGARACPVCNVATSPPLLPDVKLQRLVYLMVLGLFRSELERRRHFRLVNPQCPPLALPLGALNLTLDDFVSLSLCELDEPEGEAAVHEAENRAGSRHRTNADQTKQEDTIQVRNTRYLKCPAGVTVRHLVRLLMLKRGWEEANSNHKTNVNKIEMLCEKSNENRRNGTNTMVLDQSWTLLDLACIFGWKRVSFFFFSLSLSLSSSFIALSFPFLRYLLSFCIDLFQLVITTDHLFRDSLLSFPVTSVVPRT